MKIVKSLLLGSAAGLVAVSAGQSADLSVKAKPVQYVKVCSLYGAGFYYIPGTDTCIKIGGYLRTEWDVHAAGTFTPFLNGANAFQFRSEDNYVTRARGYLTADVREQTSYGALRGYLAAGWQFTTDDAPTISLPGAAVGTAGGGASPSNTPNSNISILRAFIQFGGFTFGKGPSFWDFFSTGKYTLQTTFLYQDFGYNFGVFTYGYTQQLSNGIAATIAVQDPTPYEHNVVDVDVAGGTLLGPTGAAAAAPTNNNEQNAGTLVPDIVASIILLDQAWGSGQVAGILHQNRARYYNANENPTGLVLPGSDHPSDKWGWGVMGGLELKTPYFDQNDTFAVQGQYCVGVSQACYDTGATRFGDLSWSLVNVNKIGLGWADDAFMANSTEAGVTGLELTTMWNVWAAFQHYWVPQLRTSIYGGYAQYTANSHAVDVEICQEINEGGEFAGITGHVANTGCMDWSAWAVGSRTLWNPAKNLDVGVDVLYTSMSKTALQGATWAFSPGGNAATSTFTVAPTHIWAGTLRIQYNFSP